MYSEIQTKNQIREPYYRFSISYSHGTKCWVASNDEEALTMFLHIPQKQIEVLAKLYELFRNSESWVDIKEDALKYSSDLNCILRFPITIIAQQLYTFHKALLFNRPEMYITFCDCYLKGNFPFADFSINELLMYSEKILSIEKKLYSKRWLDCLAIVMIMVDTGLRLGEVLKISIDDKNKNWFSVRRKCSSAESLFYWTKEQKALVEKSVSNGSTIFNQSKSFFLRRFRQATGKSSNFTIASLRRYYMLRENCLKLYGFL